MIENLLYLFPFFLCWGSFLNVLGFRLIRGQDVVWSRSCCPHCNHVIAWYDNIPVISYLMLNGKCRTCHASISFLYPFIELFTLITLSALYYSVPPTYFFSYFILISALIVTIRSDLETMLISRYVTLFLVPFGLLFSALGLLPITLPESIAGCLVGSGGLYLIAYTFFRLTGKQGLGQGDIDLLALIGSFTGIIGCWATILIGSITGSVLGLIYMRGIRSPNSIKIPFGPFLALGAICYIFWQEPIAYFLLGL